MVGVVEVEAVELAGGVADLEVAEEALEVLEASGALVGEVEERLAPELGPVDDGAECDVGAAKEVVGLGDDLDGELLVGAGVLHRAGGDVEDGDDRPELGDRQRLRRGEMVEGGELVGPVAGQAVEPERVDPLTVDADLELALLAERRGDDHEPDRLEVPGTPDGHVGVERLEQVAAVHDLATGGVERGDEGGGVGAVGAAGRCRSGPAARALRGSRCLPRSVGGSRSA